MPSQKFTSIDEYIGTFPKETQGILEKIRKVMNDNAPGTEETISYNIPCLKLNGKYVIYFAGYEHHVSVYPLAQGDDKFNEELKEYVAGAGTAKFPLDKPIRYDLIEKMTKLRLEDTKKSQGKY